MSQNESSGLAKLREEVRALQARFEQVEKSVGELRFALPPSYRAIPVETLEEVIAANPYVELTVLADWRHPDGSVLPAGRTVRADMYRDLATYVRYGLLLGAPEPRRDDAAILAQQREVRAVEERLARLRAAESAMSQAASLLDD